MPALYVPRESSVKSKVPFGSVFDALHDLARRVLELDGDARDPELALLDDAGLAAARLEVAPDDAVDGAGLRAGFTACRAPLGTSVGAIPVSPSRATPPGGGAS